MADPAGSYPFPALSDSPSPELSPYTSSQQPNNELKKTRRKGDSIASTISERVRRMSKSFEDSNPPSGFMAATGTLAADLLSLSGQTRQTFEDESRGSRSPRSPSSPRGPPPSSPRGPPPSSPREPQPSSPREPKAPDGSDRDANPAAGSGHGPREESMAPATSEDATIVPSADALEVRALAQDMEDTEPFDNGYHFPPSYPAWEATKHGAVAFWHYFLTPLGCFVVIYGLLVVAWGGMLFLLLCNASPAMCYGGCNYIDSPRRIWIEYDSQIVNALFCVTGFGLIPWRFRDLYYLLQYRIWGKEEALRRLAGIHRGWFRLQGSQDLAVDVGPDTVDSPQWAGTLPNSSIPFPESKIPDAPRTGTRAPPTRMWKLDFVIWTMVCNTFLQCVLSGFMWGMNRYNRPSWAVGLFVGLACCVAAAGGIMMFTEGKKVKGIEGVPVNERDLQRLERDRQLGIPHYNNIKDKKTKTKTDDPEGIPHVFEEKKRPLKVAGKNETET